ncbi:MAG: hypothetical protein AB7N80_05145 [Bdellovibrionales bacterium]
MVLSKILTFGFIFAANGAYATPSLRADAVKEMTCHQAIAEMQNRIALNEQLGSAYLETMATLEQVYSSWGNRLSKEQPAQKQTEIGAFFLKSAESTREARIKSAQTVSALATETRLLMDRIARVCAEK